MRASVARRLLVALRAVRWAVVVLGVVLGVVLASTAWASALGQVAVPASWFEANWQILLTMAFGTGAAYSVIQARITRLEADVATKVGEGEAKLVRELLERELVALRRELAGLSGLAAEQANIAAGQLVANEILSAIHRDLKGGRS